MTRAVSTDLDQMLADVIRNMPKFQPAMWHESKMDQLRVQTLDKTTVNHFVRDASIELLYHGYRKDRVIGFVLTGAKHLMQTNSTALLPKAREITALMLVHLAWKRDIQHLGELSPKVRRAYRKAEELAKRRPMRLNEEDALKLLLPEAAAA